MSSKLRYQRVLLKISGEALKGDSEFGYDPAAVNAAVARIAEARELGVQIALVVGAGNIWRGGSAVGMDRVTADHMGMLGTVMNALRLKDAFRKAGIPVNVHASADLRPFAPRFDRDAALDQLSRGEIVIYAGGTGCPFFTTDTTAALRALESDCQALVKATKVNGIYTADPMKDPAAKKFDELTFKQAIEGHYRIMDAAAFSLCADNNLAIVVCKFEEPGALGRVLTGDFSAGTIVS